MTNVLFGFRQGTHRYLRIDAETLNYWFPRDGQMMPKPPKAEDKQRHPQYPLKPAGEGIELFLSPHGVGLLSLTLESKPGDPLYLQAFNHRLSQLRRPTTYHYQVPHDARSPQTPPGPDTPFEQRLGARGGFFLSSSYASHADAKDPAGSHGSETAAGGGKSAKQQGRWKFFGLLALLVAAWMAVGYHCFLAEHHAINGASFLCAGGTDCEPRAAEGTI